MVSGRRTASVSRFEDRFKTTVDDTVRPAVLKNNAPGEIRDKVELEAFDTLESLESAVTG